MTRPCPRPPHPRLPLTLGCLVLVVAAAITFAGCSKPPPPESSAAAATEGALFRVGSIVIRESDLRHELDAHHEGRDDPRSREAATAALIQRARLAQAALDAGLADDPVVRDEVARLLASRFRETELGPRLEELSTIPPERLKELYEQQRDRFLVPEKRRVAVLWLNPGPDPERAQRYRERLGEARSYVLETPNLHDHPEQGFSVLGADYSEHHASRFKGGDIGWLEREGSSDPWTKAVAEIAFELGTPGDMSDVVSRNEGLFLVRLTDIRPTVLRPFESVSAELERDERSRRFREAEAAFEARIERDYPVETLGP